MTSPAPHNVSQNRNDGSHQWQPDGLRIIALGGLNEIGKNTMAICYGDDIMLVDAGLAFPSDDMVGIDVVLPDISFLLENANKIRGLAITHGHEDHIGGIPFLLKKLDLPIIHGPALALGLLESKLKEASLANKTILHKVHPRQTVSIGCFSVHFIRCTHSIADSFSLIIETPVGTIIHTGDFKFDFTPIDGELFDIASLTKAAKHGVLLLMSDSTNVEREGYTPSEKTVWKKIDEVFAVSPGRIIVTTFASNVHRVKQVLQAALKYDRKVAILGRSMLNFATMARELGYMKFPDHLILPVEALLDLAADKIVILTTGSQGEPLSALSRIAKNEHKHIKIKPGDTVIVSSTPIPGNERLISNTINQLFLHGANVIYGKEAGVHVSGHGCREEQKLMINLCRPKYFMPIHGEYRMLVKHAELATECGVKANHTFVMSNGDVLEITKNNAQLQGKVKAGKILLDSTRAWEISEAVLGQRRQLAEDGVVTIAITVDANKLLLAGPDIYMRGVILKKGLTPEALEELLTTTVTQSLKKLSPSKVDLKEYLEQEVAAFLVDHMHCHPLVQVLVQRL